jgi:hypothetical protein
MKTNIGKTDRILRAESRKYTTQKINSEEKVS